jgi:hypothetical protein
MVNFWDSLDFAHINLTGKANNDKSKYPPVKPVALKYEPLKAVC